MVASATLVGLVCLAALAAAAPAEEQGVEIVLPSQDSYSHAAANPQVQPLAVSDPGAPDHALAPPPADHVSPVARHLVIAMVPQQEEEELVREKRQFGYGGGYGRRGYGRRHRYGGYGGGYGGYPGGYGGGYGGYPGGYGGGYGGYPGGYGGGYGGSSAQSAAASQSFSIGGGFGPFQGSFSSSQASSSAGGGGFGFGR